MNPDKWLSNLLKRYGLNQPDGRMLYGYRLTDDEYLSLKNTLAFASEFGQLGEVARRIRSFPALFVLYAAEWWRREYQGGAWEWAPIIGSFGGDATQLATNARTECVQQGFAYWGHRPSGEGKKFFGAAVAQGGLPLKFIGNGGGKLASIMASALRSATRFNWDESQIAQDVADRADELPGSLHKPEIYALIAQMVRAVLDLKKEFQLTGETDPVAILNIRDPQWRERFPLQLEDIAAEALLTGLVKEAAQQTAVSSSSMFAVERLLKPIAEGQYELMSSLHCPTAVHVENLVHLFGLHTNEDIPRYFSIDAQVGEREPFADGRQILGADTATASLFVNKRYWLSTKACAEHSVFLRGPNGDLGIGPLAVPGGGELPFDEPWVFATIDGKLKWVATGSARVPEDEAMVALPEGWRIELVNSTSLVHPGGSVDLGGHKVMLHVVRGDVQLRRGEQVYRVRTLQATGMPDIYAWEGRRVGYPSSPQSIYIGIPKLYRYSSDGERNRVGATELNWFVAGTGIRIDDLNHAKGLVDVYLEQDGERLARFRFVVLKTAARTEFVSGMSASEGMIRFDGWGCTDISVDEQIDLTCEIAKSDKNIELHMRGGDMPPESVWLSMRWLRCAIELRLRLPFPSSGGRFFDSSGRSLREGDSLTLRHLVGARLRIFDRNPQAPRRYDLRMTLVQGGRQLVTAGLKVEQEVKLSQDGSAEIRLIDLSKNIETLLGFSDELDAAVDVDLLSSSRLVTSVRISRYEAILERDAVALRFPARAVERLDIGTLEGIKVKAVSVASVTNQSILLSQDHSEGVPAARWCTADLVEEHEPWLVFPDEDSSVFFRPTVWVGQNVLEQVVSSGIHSCPLTLAMSINITDDRMRAIADVLEAMSLDFMHPSWGMLEQLWEVFHHLPLSSLDVFRVLGTKPMAAAAFFLRSKLPEDDLFEFGRRLTSEVGLVLELVSINSWHAAAQNLRNYWVSLLGEDGAKLSFQIIFTDRIKRLAAEYPSLKLLMDVLVFEQTNYASEDFLDLLRMAKRDQLAHARILWHGDNSLVQKLLLRGHANDANWPERHFFEESLAGFQESATQNVLNRLTEQVMKTFFWIVPGDFKLSVANMPVLCALWVTTGTSMNWWRNPERRLALRKIKAFDPIWFELAFNHALGACLALDLLVPEISVVNN